MASNTWEKNLDFDSVTSRILNYKNKIQEDNGDETFNLSQPKLIFSYIINADSSRYIDLLGPDDITAIYNQSRNSNSEFQKDKRERIIQLLAVAHKTHFFLYPETKCVQKPKIFEYPNFWIKDTSSSFLIYELLYELNNGKSIVVSEFNSENRTFYHEKQFSNLEKFPVVLTKSPTNWLNTNFWKDIEAAKEKNKDKINVKFDSATYNKLTEFNNLNELSGQVKFYKEIDKENSNYFYIKHICSLLGGFRAKIKGINKSEYIYWPYGWDVDGIKEYLDTYESCSDILKRNIPPEIKKL